MQTLTFFEIICHVAVILQILSTLEIKYLFYRKVNDPNPLTYVEFFDKVWDIADRLDDTVTKEDIAKLKQDLKNTVVEQRLKLQDKIEHKNEDV